VILAIVDRHENIPLIGLIVPILKVFVAGSRGTGGDTRDTY
jgi:hypothetical protein